MSHAIQSTDRLVLTGRPAWHGLGVVLPEAPTVREALEQALPWDVVTRPIFSSAPDRPEYEAADAVPGAYVWTTDGEPLAPVSDGYVPVTNKDLALLAETCEDIAGARVETVGSLRGRRSVFLLLRVGTYGVGLNGDDETVEYLALTTAHDGTAALRGFGTSVRIVCANTESAARGAADARGHGFAIRHSGDVAARLETARDAIRKGNIALAALRDQSMALAAAPMTVARVGDYFGRVASIVYPALAAERPTDPKEAGAWERQRARAKATVSAWVEELEHERQRLVSGTAYAALQAVTHWADHGRPRVRQAAADRLLGRGSAIKAQARKLALEVL